MLVEIIKQFNWIDVLIILVIGRIIYIGIKLGFPSEIFKLFGSIVALYLAFHYYTIVSDYFDERFDLRVMPLEFLDFLLFTVLSAMGYAIFVGLRAVFTRGIKVEAVPRLHKWGGFVLSVARSALLASLFMYMFVISSISYLKNSVTHSYTGSRILELAPSTYRWLWDNLMSKFMTKEKFNDATTEILENL
jgi:uncharacterized membrane protein required for colicin V production